MSTRCWIGKLKKDGNVDFIYCHYDGYIDGVGMTLHRFYQDEKKIDELLELDDISALKEDIKKIEYCKCEKLTLPLAKYLDCPDKPYIEYVYLWRNNGWEGIETKSDIRIILKQYADKLTWRKVLDEIYNSFVDDIHTEDEAMKFVIDLIEDDNSGLVKLQRYNKSRLGRNIETMRHFDFLSDDDQRKVKEFLMA